jgi:NAD(P)-dependent dehydrogenase (short-subunit alcohol dehydrogenase family)
MRRRRQRQDSRRALLTTMGLGLGLAGREALQRLREADLRGQVALITGGSRGLGFLLARELAREGCRLVICARDEQELEQARKDLEQRGAEVLAVPCDVADRAQVDHLIAEATGRFGRVDILVNNAGIIQVGPIETMTIQDFEDAMGVMFWGVVYPTLAVLPQMQERRSGRIVNITSIGGKVSVPHLIPYNCAKFAAVGFSEGLRAKLAQDGISVTTIVPGLMRTGSFLNAFFKGRQEAEFTWFALGSSLPLISMDAERAARQIVSAAKRGESERILTLPAHLVARFNGLFPGTTADLLGLVNRIVLPRAGGAGKAPARGMEVQERLHSQLLNFLTSLGRSAAHRFHQFPGPSRE